MIAVKCFNFFAGIVVKDYCLHVLEIVNLAVLSVCLVLALASLVIVVYTKNKISSTKDAKLMRALGLMAKPNPNKNEKLPRKKGMPRPSVNSESSYA